MVAQRHNAKKTCMAAAVGTVLAALCCFTPLLVGLLGILGLGFLTRYLDYVLFPALGVLLLLTILAYRKWRRAG